MSSNGNMDPLREYSKPAAPAAPRGSPNMLDLLASTSVMRIWTMRSPHKLEDILADSYWQHMQDVRLRAQDRIEFVCEAFARQPVHGTLLVESSDKKGNVSVVLLQRFERAQ